MYDLFTSTVLFVILTPGMLTMLPPSGGVLAVLVHAAAFYAIQAVAAQFIPWQVIWVLGSMVLFYRLYSLRTSSAPPIY